MKETLAWTEYCKSLAPAIVETCAKVHVSSGPGALVKALSNALPEWKFRHALSRGGWYRLGGILDATTASAFPIAWKAGSKQALINATAILPSSVTTLPDRNSTPPVWSAPDPLPGCLGR
jgi:hypothetical protein